MEEHSSSPEVVAINKLVPGPIVSMANACMSDVVARTKHGETLSSVLGAGGL